jgi:hypothetical protein
MRIGAARYFLIQVDYWIVTLIAGAAGVATGLVVIVTVVLPVTVILSVPLFDAAVIASPK